MAQLEDVSQVEKYQISEEEYSKRDNTFRKFKEEVKKKNPNFFSKTQQKIPENFQEEEAKAIAPDSRCEVTIGQRRGQVKYVGKVPELGAGYWVGIVLDEPTGDSDGTVKGKQYFECPQGPKFGVFVRPKDILVGDSPPANDFDAEEDEI